MLRDQIRDIEYFEKYRKTNVASIERGIEWLKIGKVVPSQIDWFKKGIFDNHFFLLVSGYSYGKGKDGMREDLSRCADYLNEGWSPKTVKVERDGSYLDQYYLYAYDEMLWMLSLGYLLDAPEQDFKKLVEVIDRDKVKDKLFEFIISAKLKDRAPIKEESYRDFFGVPETFAKLRESIDEPDKGKASKLIHDFLKKDWYKNHKDAGWYNSHKSKHDTYFGYWSFESAALVKIKGLDDTSFRDNQYYPKAFML